MITTPLVSIVLPVYNVAAHIQDTMSSLLKQTLPDFELLILDDCSTDNTVDRIKAVHDPRIRLIQNDQNLGRAGTDNAALQHVTGQYIAKMDGDDICHPERLAKQVAVLRQQPDVNVVGSWMQNFGASSYLNQYPESSAEAQVMTLFTLPTGNPSVMLRTELLREQGLQYDATLRQTEDYDFFARYIRELRIHTIQEALIQYRVPPDIRKKEILSERATVADMVREQLLTRWKVSFTSEELKTHNTIAMLNHGAGVSLQKVERWLLKLLAHNTQEAWFQPQALQRVLAQRWFEVCYTYRQPHLDGFRHFYRSPLSAGYSLGARQQAKFLFQALRGF
ncbi:glycosyltransferase family 2 protein [Hymenobacter terrestris]|uniref:Glycosyltransferase family 2 protein n=1 Tax=Hymenobacter terrestris TaxID=2748310 RepID=A0ABX2Q4N6_9BACT|nr:glycosyltransferase family A protein [Hymenobacter terrestris]NVO85928.1 glycosyltransferase family 2 protein [Hymenobacter terrestris]